MAARPHLGSRRSHLAGALAALLAAAPGCNELLGIVPGEPAPGGGGTGASPSAGGSGGSGGCSLGTPPEATGKPIRQRIPMGTSLNDGRGIAVDMDGNTVVVGSFAGADLDFGGGPLPYQGPPGYPDGNIYVVKYDPTGKHLYSVSFGGDEVAYAEAVTTDAAGNILVTGVMSGHVDFGGTMLYAPNDPGEYRNDAFVVKLSPTLDVLWAKNFGDNGWQQFGLGVAANAAGDVVVAGALFDLADFGTGTIGAAGVWSTFLLTLDAGGAPLWSLSFASWAAVTPNYYDWPSLGVALAPDGDVVLASTLDDQAYFFDSPVATSGEADAYVMRISPDGTSLRWLSLFHGAPGAGAQEGSQWAGPVAVDPCGDVLVAGGFTHSLAIGGVEEKVTAGDPVDADGFVARLSGATGEVVWHRIFGDAGRQEPYALATDAWGNVVVTGALQDAAGWAGVDFGSGIGVLTPKLPPEPDYREDSFLVKYDASGNGLWGIRFSDAERQIGYDVATFPSGDIVWTGIFYGSIALGNGLPVATANNDDVFTVWLSP